MRPERGLPRVSSLLCYSSSSHVGAPGSRESGTQLWLCSQGRLESWETLAQQAWGSSVSPAPEGGLVHHESLRFQKDGSCLSKGFSVPWNCTECLLWLFLLPPFFLLTLPIRPSESPDSTGKQQMLTLLRSSQRQLSPLEWGEGRKVRGGKWRKITLVLSKL